MSNLWIATLLLFTIACNSDELRAELSQSKDVTPSFSRIAFKNELYTQICLVFETSVPTKNQVLNDSDLYDNDKAHTAYFHSIFSDQQSACGQKSYLVHDTNNPRDSLLIRGPPKSPIAYQLIY